MSYRYRFEVDWESPDEWGIGLVPGLKMPQGTEPTGPELATVLRQLAKELDTWSLRPCRLKIRYPARPTGDA